MVPLLVSFKRVTFSYETGHEVFRDATFKIEKGGFYYLTGASGVGKSTLLKLIYLANQNYLGSIEVFGKELKNITQDETAKFRQNIGIVFQEFSLLDHLSTVDNVALPLVLLGMKLSNARERAAELLSWFGLGNFIHQTPTLLSGGQRQRVAIARAAVNSPQLLLADEPTGNIDDENAVKLLHLFEVLNRQGVTVVLATHNRDLISAFNYPQIHIDKGVVTTWAADQTYLKEIQHGA